MSRVYPRCWHNFVVRLGCWLYSVLLHVTATYDSTYLYLYTSITSHHTLTPNTMTTYQTTRVHASLGQVTSLPRVSLSGASFDTRDSCGGRSAATPRPISCLKLMSGHCVMVRTSEHSNVVNRDFGFASLLGHSWPCLWLALCYPVVSLSVSENQAALRGLYTRPR
jgi:hypothetical protein